MNGHSFLNISNSWLLHIATHLFTKSVSCRSAKYTTVHGVSKEVYMCIARNRALDLHGGK